MTFYEAKAKPYGLNNYKDEFFEFSKRNLIKIKEELKKDNEEKRIEEEKESKLHESKIA